MSTYSGQSTKVMAALCTPMNPLPSSWMNARKSAFCCVPISRSPPVKKSTASKSFKFLALYSNFFLVRTSVSVRRVVSHSPVCFPSRSIVAIAWETASCLYPFSSPMTRSCFLGGAAGDCAPQRLPRLMLNTKHAIRIMFFMKVSCRNALLASHTAVPAQTAPLSPCQTLNHLRRISRKLQTGTREILLHVLAIGSAGQRQHPDRAGKGKYNLRRSRSSPRRKGRDHRVSKHLRIRGKQRESLIRDLPLAAEQAHFAVPAEARVTPV